MPVKNEQLEEQYVEVIKDLLDVATSAIADIREWDPDSETAQELEKTLETIFENSPVPKIKQIWTMDRL